MLRGPPGPRSLRLMSRRSSTPRVSRSRTALVFFSSTLRRTSPRNMMGCGKKGRSLRRTWVNSSWHVSKLLIAFQRSHAHTCTHMHTLWGKRRQVTHEEKNGSKTTTKEKWVMKWYMPLLPWPPGFFGQDQGHQRPQIQSWATSHRHPWCWFAVQLRFHTLQQERTTRAFTWDDSWNMTWWTLLPTSQRTHEELFELVLVDVMWEVAHKQLVAVRVPYNSPGVQITRFWISTTCTCQTLNYFTPTAEN